MAKQKETRGRKPRGGEPSSLFAIRLTHEELAKYREAATAAGMSVSEWVRAACAAFLKRSKR